MDSMSDTLSDDDYDVISNPGHHSLESSIANVQPVSEPQPCPAARETFVASQWTAQDIQEYVRRVAGERLSSLGHGENKVVRVYVDGIFDPLSVGNVLQLRQAKLSFPKVYLIVGVFSDQTIKDHGYHTPRPEVERYELLRHCRWVDEITPGAPWELDEDFLRQHRIDMVAIEEGASISPAYDKVRVRGYDEVKKLGKAIPTRKVFGYQLSSGSSESPKFLTPTPPFVEPPEDFNGHINIGNVL